MSAETMLAMSDDEFDNWICGEGIPDLLQHLRTLKPISSPHAAERIELIVTEIHNALDETRREVALILTN